MALESQFPTAEARRHARRMAAALSPSAARMTRQFAAGLRAAGYCPDAIRGLAAITPAAASLCRTSDAFLEQVEYNGRRLAKLNVAPGEVLDRLREFGVQVDSALAGRFQPAREQLELATRLALNQAYYEVREAEAQALFGIYRAEIEASDFSDFLRRLVRVLTPALRARSGRILELAEPYAGEFTKPQFVWRKADRVRLIADARMRARYESFWSYPLADGVVAQFGFPAQYPWLPRELALLGTAAERVRSQQERWRLAAENLRLHAEARHAEEEERKRIGRELHDEAGQSLLLLRLQLEMLEREAAAPMRASLVESRRVVETAITEIRRIVSALSPQVLERLGLLAALRHLGARFQKMHTAELEMRIPRRLPALAPAVGEAVYRITQEALLNIAKHSDAKKVKISVRTADSYIRLRVADNGSGFSGGDAARKPLSFGMAGMGERARLLGGKFETIAAPGKGVTVKLELPLREAPDKKDAKDSRIAD